MPATRLSRQCLQVARIAGTWAGSDNARVSEAPATPIPRRGRIWVILLLALAVGALGYAIVGISTQEAGSGVVRVAGIGEMQEIFGGVPQEGDRVGSGDAPVSIQIFNDLQCSSCASGFLGPIPGLMEEYVRPGDVKLLMRHYSVLYAPHEGFFAAEAAAEQGYGWQYTYLFFRNQDEAERLGQVNEEFLETLAGSVGELNVGEWRDYLEDERGPGGAITSTLEGYEDLGTELGIRERPAAIVNGPSGTLTLQDAPSLQRIERAIEAVE
jgi:protein-disulfide isomerase